MNRSRQILCVRRVLFKLVFWMMCTTLSDSQLLSPSFSFVPSLSLSPSLYSLLSLVLSLSTTMSSTSSFIHLSIDPYILNSSLSLSLSLCLALYITVFSIRLSTYLFPSPSSYSELFSFCHSFCLLPISLLYIL